jgi:type IV pilus assembly protein PilW
MKAYQHSTVQGFTLVELMVALVLGLLLTAAAVQLLVTGTLTFSNQRNASDVQDNATFGLGLINQQLRRTNAGNLADIADSGLGNGVVFKGTDVVATPAVTIPVTAQDTNLAATVDAKSDQLVIQYRTAQTGMRDCEGADIVSGDTVLERYFLRTDTTSSETPKPLALACAAFRTTNLTNVATATGSIILNRVEDMRVLIGTSIVTTDPMTNVKTAQWRYDPITQYQKQILTSPDLKIRTIQIGVLLRSTDSDSATASIKRASSYKLLDQTATVQKNSDGYMRRVFTTTVSFRNSLGEAL